MAVTDVKNYCLERNPVRQFTQFTFSLQWIITARLIFSSLLTKSKSSTGQRVCTPIFNPFVMTKMQWSNTITEYDNKNKI